MFSYRGVIYRETVKHLDATKKNGQRAAVNMKASIDDAISRGVFEYGHYFPNSNSRKAKALVKLENNITIGEIVNELVIDAQRKRAENGAKFFEKCANTFLSDLAEIRVIDLRPAHIRNWIRKQTVILKTIRDRLGPLRKAIKVALSDDIIQKNPFDNIIVAELVSHDQLKTNYIADPFSQDEIDRILIAAENIYGSLIKNFIQFAIYSGLRTSELFGLCWETINFELGIVSVRRVITDGLEKEITKTKAGLRDVIMLPKARDALISQFSLTGEVNKYVFVRPMNRGHFFDYDHLSHLWRKILTQAKVKYRNPYQTRHTYASQLLSGGENMWFVAEQLGHENVEMINRHYGKWIAQSDNKNQHEFVAQFGK